MLSPAQEFVYTRTYSRWLPAEGRRERWPETVDRYCSFLAEERGKLVPAKVLRKISEGINSMGVMPSMRLLWAAGPAAHASHVTAYNCAFAEVDSILSFSECLYILMCGSGYGFSVTAEAVAKLPVVPHLSGESVGTFVVEDSREGWAESVKALMTALYAGHSIDINYNLVRPRGARLLTMGGRSSGPAPLMQLHQFIREVFEHAQGRNLTPLECHDICNQIAEIVVVGGVRRSSQISLSDLSDEDMRWAKEHPFPLRRAMANNSAIYTEQPSAVDFLHEWAALAGSGTGERGIFNLVAARATSPRRRDALRIRGVNPCSEILLRSRQFCNLSEIVVRADDDLDSLLEKVETATWMGAIQSTFTDFPYLSSAWRKNCEDERLLGVSITGQMDNPSILTADALRALKARALKTAKHAAGKLGTNVPAAVTCVKPSGTVSQLVDSASGLHPRYAEYYYRRYRVAAVDPIIPMLNSQGFPLSPENGQRPTDWAKAMKLYKQGKSIAGACTIFNKGEWSPEHVMTWVATFPQRSPAGARTRNDMSALDQLEWYKHLQTNWCEHNASCFSGETKFITDKGLRAFNSFKDGAKVSVLGADRKFKEAVVRKMDNQPIVELTLRKNGISFTIETTDDHLWPVTYGHQRWVGYKSKLYKTIDLPIGKQLELIIPEAIDISAERTAKLHGIVFGDGSFHKQGHYTDRNCIIAICGDSRHLSTLFDGFGKCTIKQRDDINQTRVYGLPSDWKQLPEESASPAYIRAFVAGWFAADGSVSKDGGGVTITSKSLDNMLWLQRIAPRAGLAVSTQIQRYVNTKGYKPGSVHYTLAFLHGSLDAPFFLHDKKLARWSRQKVKQSSKRWRIENVRLTDRETTVWCVEEPKDHLFVLEGNILTHNCTVYVRPEEWFAVGEWVYRNWSVVNGVSFLPFDDTTTKYEQLPYEEISSEVYTAALASHISIDFSRLPEFEKDDFGTGASTAACVGTSCEL